MNSIWNDVAWVTATDSLVYPRRMYVPTLLEWVQGDGHRPHLEPDAM